MRINTSGSKETKKQYTREQECTFASLSMDRPLSSSSRSSSRTHKCNHPTKSSLHEKKKKIVCHKIFTKICFKKDILIQICFGKNFETIKTKIVFNTRIQDLLLSSIFLRSKFLEKHGCLISLTRATLPLLAKSRSDSAKRQEIKFSHQNTKRRTLLPPRLLRRRSFVARLAVLFLVWQNLATWRL